jgi:hypothetical protein
LLDRETKRGREKRGGIQNGLPRTKFKKMAKSWAKNLAPQDAFGIMLRTPSPQTLASNNQP